MILASNQPYFLPYISYVLFERQCGFGQKPRSLPAESDAKGADAVFF